MPYTNDPDAAFAALRRTRAEFGQFLVETPEPTEADTRANLIDRILTEVCAWPSDMIRREPHVESGYIDYSLLVRSRPHVCVEAKRAGVTFSFPATRSKTLKLSGPLLTDQPIADAINQVRTYCIDEGIRYAVATNGDAWIIVTVQVPQSIFLDKSRGIGYRRVDECESGSPDKATRGSGE